MTVTITNVIEKRGTPNKDMIVPFHDKLSLGWVGNGSVINKFGRNIDIDSGTEDVIDLGATLLLATAATIATITSSSGNDVLGGSGAEKIIIYGLDNNFDLASEEISLNATPPTTNTLWWFIHRIVVTQSNNGANDAYNAGTITAAVDSKNIAQIATGLNQTRMAAFMVPRNTDALMSGFWGKFYGAFADATIELTVEVKEFGKPFVSTLPIAISYDKSVLKPSDEYHPFFYEKPKYSEKTIIKIKAVSTVSDCDIAAGFDLSLYPNA